MDWSPGLVVHHYLTLMHQALYHEFAGNSVEAVEFAMQARELAPSVPFAVLGWGLSASIARNAGELSSAKAFAKRAERLLATIDTRDLRGEERFALLSVAEGIAHFDPAGANTLFATYWGLAPVDKMLSLSGDPRLTADETYVEGVVADGLGEIDRAERCYRTAYETFRAIGYVRRAASCAYALILLGRADADLRAYVWSVVAGTRNYLCTALRSRADESIDARLAALERHPIIAALPPSQREVVVLICSGKTNKEIAQLRNVGEQTIKNMLTRYVFRAFGVSSRSALVSMCLGERSPSQEYEGTALQAPAVTRR
jgi:DNA-binding CsgD family transcriptional regulator